MARRGEIAHQMFFISRGTLSVLVPDNTKTKEAQSDVANAKTVNTLKCLGHSDMRKTRQSSEL